MSIFKVNKLTDKDTIEIIYVFFGNNLGSKDDPNDIFDDNPKDPMFRNVFTSQELENIEKYNTPVKFINKSIYIDDNIGTIKLKIFEAIDREASINEMYLFCLKKEILNPITVYQSLTQNEKIPLTNLRLQQITSNLYDENGKRIDQILSENKKEKYTFDDILKMDLIDTNYLVGKPLGQKVVLLQEYPLIANPFLVRVSDPLLERSRNEISTLNNNLLLETGDFFQNNIYLCLAKDVFEVGDIEGSDTEYLSKIYYPFLYQDGIETIEELDVKRNTLITKSTEKINSYDTQRYLETIDMFYNMYKTKIQTNAMSENGNKTGIKGIKIVIHPDFKVKIPIDVIFKLVHATEEFPLIKYNPEQKQENIYRLYCDKKTADGRKIPFLNKATIFKLVKGVGKSKSVTVYTSIQYNGNNYDMAVEFEDNGAIIAYSLAEFVSPILISDGKFYDNLEQIFSLAINPILEQIKPFFEQSGLNIPLFTSILGQNIEIRDMLFTTTYSITSLFDVNKMIGCVSTIFAIESSNLKKGLKMRYKRVSNFNKKDSQDAFVIEKIDQGAKFDEIVDQLLKNYDDLTEETAGELIMNIRSELEVVRGANRRRTIMIKINPGFLTTIELNSITSELTINMSGINNIQYLNTIPIFINSFVRITQDKNSSKISSKQIQTLCSGKEIKDVDFDKITAQSEKSIESNEVPSFVGEEAIYSDNKQFDEMEQGENMEDILDMLGIDEDEDEIEKGGQRTDSNSSSSSVSLSSESAVGLSEDSVSEKLDLSSLDDLASIKSDNDSNKNMSSEQEEPSIKVSSTKEEVPSVKVLSSEEEPIKLSSEKSVSEEEVPSVKVSSSEEEPIKLSSEKSVSEEEVPSVKVSSSEEEPIKLSSEKSVSEEEVPSVKVSSFQEEVPSVKVSSSEEKPIKLSSVKSVSDQEVPSVKVSSSEEEPIKLSSEKSVSEEEVPSVKVSSTKSISEKPLTKFVIESSSIDDSDTKSSSSDTTIVEPVKVTNTAREIEGVMKLKYPNPFTSRLEQRMPQLFIREKNDKIDLYTRMCPFSLSERRQPVILTKEERDKIIEEHPNDIDKNADFVEYGTDPKDSSKKFYYTCPRYWCLLTDTAVTEKDILNGKCGPKVDKVEDAIIPRTADVVPKNRYVYQFYSDKEKKYPGFHKEKMPNGLCIPCCFSNWSTPAMKNRRDICQGKYDEKKAEKVDEGERLIEEQIRKEVVEMEQYVKGPEKYGPQLGEHRWGFLPVVIQKFLHEVNEDCQISKTNMSLKLNHTCILRHGVEVNSLQSFIACIASAVFYAQQDDISKSPLIKRYFPESKYDVPSIKEMKQLFIKSLTLDRFIKLQNGDLINVFANPENNNIDLNKYSNSKIFKKIKTDLDRDFVKKVAQSFEKYILFLQDDSVTIDYMYLWDLVSLPNPYIFEAGINLVILEIPEDDTTNNVELVCPANHYSSHTYDARKRSLILIKRENYFEPVYGYKNDGKNIQITKTFSEYDKLLPKTLRAVFAKIIKPTIGDKCRALPSQPNEYRFKNPQFLDTLIGTLINKNYKIITQVLNYQGKVIGLQVKNKKGLEGFVPCFPSSLTSLKKNKKNCSPNDEDECDYPFTYINDDLWKPYEETLEFLKMYYDYEEPTDHIKANCYDPKYFCRIVEDELITGFLTNTNQFIPIKDPVPISNVVEELKTITSSNMLVADMNTLTNNKSDTKRVDFIKRIQLETNFYNVFRNTIRILFNDYSNSSMRKKIQDECNKRYVSYLQQLKAVKEMLHELVDTKIIFATQENGFDYKKLNENEIYTCLKSNKEKCDKKSQICKYINEQCVLILPKNNLVTNIDNEDFYFGKMADELVRYNRIKSFMFRPQSYLAFGQVKYNLRDNEIIILQDLLTQDFFEGLIPYELNKYAQFNTFDNAEPIISKMYPNNLEINDVINPYHERDCQQSAPEDIQSLRWKKCFTSDYKEISYKGSNYCSLYLLVDLIKEHHKKDVTVEMLKEQLIEEYSRLTDNFTNNERLEKIIDILREEAQFDANQLQDNSITFEQMILQDGFCAINFDLWLLLVKNKIPSVFISSKPINETRFNFYEFVCYTTSNENKFSFILTPAMYRRKEYKLPEYRLIVKANQSTIINLDEIKETCLETISVALDNYISPEDYIDIVFEKDITTRYKKKKQGIRKIKFEIDEEEKPVRLVLEDEEEEEPVIKDEDVPKVVPIRFEIEDEEEEEKYNLEKEILEKPLVQEDTTEKKKTRKNKQKIKVNPPGKKGTRKQQPIKFIVEEESPKQSI